MEHSIAIVLLIIYLHITIDLIGLTIEFIKDVHRFFKSLKQTPKEKPKKKDDDSSVKQIIHDYPRAARLVIDSAICHDEVIFYQYVSENLRHPFANFKFHNSQRFHVWGFVKAYVLIFGCPKVGDKLTLTKDAPSITRQCPPRNSGPHRYGEIMKIIKIEKVGRKHKEQQRDEEREVLSYVPMYLQILDYNKSWADTSNKWLTETTIEFKDGEKYKGEVRDGFAHGKGEFFYKSGSSAKGIWQNGEYQDGSISNVGYKRNRTHFFS